MNLGGQRRAGRVAQLLVGVVHLPAVGVHVVMLVKIDGVKLDRRVGEVARLELGIHRAAVRAAERAQRIVAAVEVVGHAIVLTPPVCRESLLLLQQ